MFISRESGNSSFDLVTSGPCNHGKRNNKKCAEKDARYFAFDVREKATAAKIANSTASAIMPPREPERKIVAP